MVDERDHSQTDPAQVNPAADDEHAEFEIGHHKVPWFLWLFFSLIVTWASISWIKFFGY
jgi:hypothetical protein